MSPKRFKTKDLDIRIRGFYDSSAAEDEKKRKEKIESLRRERLKGREEQLREKRLRQEQEKSMNLWEMALRYKREEVDKIRELKMKEEEWANKMEIRRGYNAQIVSFVRNFRSEIEYIRFFNGGGGSWVVDTTTKSLSLQSFEKNLRSRIFKREATGYVFSGKRLWNINKFRVENFFRKKRFT